MEYAVICLIAFFVSGLTLFSGFGLGTLLMPAFALFFPVPVAIAATAVVHLANNGFKTALVGRRADWAVVLRFALPGAAAAMVGAWLLYLFSGLSPVFQYRFWGHPHQVDLVRVVIGILIMGFALLDLLPSFSNLAFERKYLSAGGVLSGFFGGLSGIQGALRAAFLIKTGLGKEAFIGTSTVSAVIVDAARLIIYGISFYSHKFAGLTGPMGPLMIVAVGSAFLGSFVGTRVLEKVTIGAIQTIVGVLLIIVGLGLVTGLL